MEINRIYNTNYFNSFYHPEKKSEVSFRGKVPVSLSRVGESADKFVKRPVATKSATGLLGLIPRIANHFAECKQNFMNTYDHKIVFSIIEQKLLGKNTIDSLTHDSDKLLMYALGFSHSFVQPTHRHHSEHHIENNIKKNIHSVAIDNIASSPYFKPKNKKGMREYFATSPELQAIDGLKEFLEKINYGEDLDFAEINKIKEQRKHSATQIGKTILLSAFAVFLPR